MYYLALHPKCQFTPMAVFSDDPRKIVNDILDTSSTCQGATRDFTLEKCDVFRLDPGGFYCWNEKQEPFEIDGHKFEIQLTKISDVLWLTDSEVLDRERLPGYIRFRNFRQNVIIPKPLLLKVREKLLELSKSEAALAAHIEDAEVKLRIEKNSQGSVWFPRIPRE